MLPVFKPLVWALYCPCHCCCCRLLHYGEGKRCLLFGRWCRRYAAHFIAVGVGFYTTARVNDAPFSAVVVGVMLPFTAVDAAFYTTARVNVGNLSAIGVGVKLLNFTAVGAAFYTTASCLLYTSPSPRDRG